MWRGRTDVNIDALSALDAVGAKFQTIVRDAESLEVPFAHALPARLQIKAAEARAFRELGERAEAPPPTSPRSRTRTRRCRHRGRARGASERSTARGARRESGGAAGRRAREPAEDARLLTKKSWRASLRRCAVCARRSSRRATSGRGRRRRRAPGGVGRAAVLRVARRAAGAVADALSGEDVALGLDATASNVEARVLDAVAEDGAGRDFPGARQLVQRRLRNRRATRPGANLGVRSPDDHAQYRFGVVCARIVADSVCW